MKIACFDDYRVGLIDPDGVRDVTSALPSFLGEMPWERINFLIRNWDRLRDAIQEAAAGSPATPRSSVRLRAASPAPRHIFAAPANYRKHIGELGALAVTPTSRSAREQGFFLKAPGSLVGADDAIELPQGSARRFDHESELAVIVGRRARNVQRDQAHRFIFGYSCLMDITMRIEPVAGQEERSMRKSFQTFTPLGPYITTADEIADARGLSNRLSVNGETRQSANTADMIVDVGELMELVSSVVTLEPGDVIATGTPEGVDRIVAGDAVSIEIQSVGAMTLIVRESEDRAPRAF